MTVYLLYAGFSEELLGVFKTKELAQRWAENEYYRGSWTAGELASCYIEACSVVTELEGE